MKNRTYVWITYGDLYSYPIDIRRITIGVDSISGYLNKRYKDYVKKCIELSS